MRSRTGCGRSGCSTIAAARFCSPTPDVRRKATIDGIIFEPLDGAAVGAIRAEMSGSNMDAVPLEKAPKIAVYTPPEAPPWDDAVTLALKYAGIEYAKVYDEEVVKGDLTKYDWLHLHHEDFTGQLNKLYLGFRDAPWFIAQRDRTLLMAKQLGFATIPTLKRSGRREDSPVRGARRISVRDVRRDGDAGARDRGASDRHRGELRRRHADGGRRRCQDGLEARVRVHARAPRAVAVRQRDERHRRASGERAGRRQPLGPFTLFCFSAKFDPVATMLVQNHRTVIPDFYGVTTSFTKTMLKPGVTVLANEEGAPWVKYIHGDYGKGSWTFLGGHDPEDPQHNIGAAPTDLSLLPASPGYRLILNNVLFPAAKKKPLKT